MTDLERHFAVLGSPIAHSKSPVLHRAAYACLCLPWGYEAIEVGSGGLKDFLESRDDRWHGFSLTMPLKREILPLLGATDELVKLVGAANTVLIDDGRLLGFNTDIDGVTAALLEMGLERPSFVRVLGAGATAASIVTAVARMGASSVAVSTRSPGKAKELATLAERLGITLALVGFDRNDNERIMDGEGRMPDVVISALPGGATLDQELALELRASVPLLDVAYAPWPTPLATSWISAGGRVGSGLSMLVHQALLQVRIFLNGDANLPLPDEPLVVDAMRYAVGLDPKTTPS